MQHRVATPMASLTVSVIVMCAAGLHPQQQQGALPPMAPTAAAASAEGTSLVVPAGTAIPATLIAEVRRRSTPVGASVRAQVAFPVLAGGRLAIPAGSFLEGTLLAAPPASKTARHPARVLHFTRLLLANGATVLLDGTVQRARLQPLTPGSTLDTRGSTLEPQEAMSTKEAAPGHGGGSGFSLEPQQTTTPTLPAPQSHYGPVIGLAVGGAAAVGAVAILAHHHASHADTVEYGAGAQITVVLGAPLMLRSADVTASAAMGPR